MYTATYLGNLSFTLQPEADMTFHYDVENDCFEPDSEFETMDDIDTYHAYNDQAFQIDMHKEWDFARKIEVPVFVKDEHYDR